MSTTVGTIPYGYRLDDRGVTLVLVEAEQAVIRDIATIRAERKSQGAIARELTRRGVPTKTDRATWTHRVVASIMSRNGAAG